MDDEELGEKVEQLLTEAQANPMAAGLHEYIAERIVPYTVNAQLKHDDVMTAIEIAYPMIRDTLLGEANAPKER